MTSEIDKRVNIIVDLVTTGSTNKVKATMNAILSDIDAVRTANKGLFEAAQTSKVRNYTKQLSKMGIVLENSGQIKTFDALYAGMDRYGRKAQENVNRQKKEIVTMRKRNKFQMEYLSLLFMGMQVGKLTSNMIAQSKKVQTQMERNNKEMGKMIDNSSFMTWWLETMGGTAKAVGGDIIGLVDVLSQLAMWGAQGLLLMNAITIWKSRAALAAMDLRLATMQESMAVAYNTQVLTADTAAQQHGIISRITGVKASAMSRVATLRDSEAIKKRTGGQLSLNMAMRASPLIAIIGLIASLAAGSEELSMVFGALTVGLMVLSMASWATGGSFASLATTGVAAGAGAAAAGAGMAVATPAAAGLSAALTPMLPIVLIIGAVLAVIAVIVLALTGNFDNLSKSIGNFGKGISGTFSKGKKDAFDFVKSTGDWFNWLGIQTDAAWEQMDGGKNKDGTAIPLDQLSEYAQLLAQLPEDMQQKYEGVGLSVLEDVVWNYQIAQVSNMGTVLDTLYDQVKEDYSLGNIDTQTYNIWEATIQNARDGLEDLKTQLIETKKPIVPFDAAMQDVIATLSETTPDSPLLDGIIKMLTSSTSKAIDLNTAMLQIVNTINGGLDSGSANIVRTLFNIFSPFSGAVDDVALSMLGLDSDVNASSLSMVERMKAIANAMATTSDYSSNEFRTKIVNAFDASSNHSLAFANVMQSAMGSARTATEGLVYSNKVTLFGALDKIQQKAALPFDIMTEAMADSSKAGNTLISTLRGVSSALTTLQFGPLTGSLVSPLLDVLFGGRSYANGGPVTETGSALVHQGEYVLSEKMLRNGIPLSQTVSSSQSDKSSKSYQQVNINLSGVEVHSPMDIHTMMDEIERRLSVRALRG